MPAIVPGEREIDDLVRRLVSLEDELERKLEAQRSRFKYRMEKERAVFEEEVLRQHRKIRTGILTFLRRSPLAALVVAPAVYGFIDYGDAEGFRAELNALRAEVGRGQGAQAAGRQGRKDG